MKPEILERQIAYAGYLTVERLRMRLTDGAEVSREVERHGDAAAVLPYDVERRSALVVRLFRAPVLVASAEEMSEEACAGMIENEDSDTTARRGARTELWAEADLNFRDARAAQLSCCRRHCQHTSGTPWPRGISWGATVG
jgi:hypothetical protein